MEFVYFENPNLGLSTGWKEHVLSNNGPDISFDQTTLSSGGVDYTVFIFGEFFNQRMTIYWTESANNDWSDQGNVSLFNL